MADVVLWGLESPDVAFFSSVNRDIYCKSYVILLCFAELVPSFISQ